MQKGKKKKKKTVLRDKTRPESDSNMTQSLELLKRELKRTMIKNK